MIAERYLNYLYGSSLYYYCTYCIILLAYLSPPLVPAYRHNTTFIDKITPQANLYNHQCAPPPPPQKYNIVSYIYLYSLILRISDKRYRLIIQVFLLLLLSPRGLVGEAGEGKV